MVGALEAFGTADGGGSGYFDDSELIHPDTDQLKDYQTYVHKGTGKGQKRFVTAFTPGSDRVTYVPTGTTLDTSSQYVILRPGWDVDVLFDAINDAIAAVRGRMLHDVVDSTLVLNDILHGAGAMERWANGAALAPDDWTLFGTGAAVARDGSHFIPIDESHLYSAQLTSDGTNLAGLRFSVADYLRYASDVFTVKADVRVNTGSRVQLRLLDGTNTYVSDTITATGAFAEATVSSKTVAGTPTKLDLELYISSGGAVVAEFDNVRLLWESGTMVEYKLPTGLRVIRNIYKETANRGQYFASPFPQGEHGGQPYWRPSGNEATPTIVWQGVPLINQGAPDETSLSGGLAGITSDRHIRIEGQKEPGVLSDDGDILPLNRTYIINQAAIYWASSTPKSVRGDLSTEIRTWQFQVDDALRTMNTRVASSGRLVRRY